MKLFNSTREFFWPLLEKANIPAPKKLNQEDIIVSSNRLEWTLDSAIKCYEAENERNKIVEGKSSLFIGTISVITSVVIGITSVILKINDFDNSVTLLVILLFLLTLYMSRTIWFSIKALERKSYHTISISDFLISDSDDIYFRRLIAEITNKIRMNSITINNKVDSMTMAQEYFKRSIIIALIYVFVTLLLFLAKLDIDFMKYLKIIIGLVNTINLSSWNLIVVYLLVLSSLILSIRA